MIENLKVYGLEESVKASKYPMAVDINKCTSEVTPTTTKLATSKKGEGHDNWLNGVVVQFDLTFSLKAWTEMQRYHFIDFVSSQSTMHRITKFDIESQCNEYVDKDILKILKNKVEAYNTYSQWLNEHRKNMTTETIKQNEQNLKDGYLNILYNIPTGFQLTARMTTNYRQLKTIYAQRKNHRLKEWRDFCEELKSLPHSEWITGEI